MYKKFQGYSILTSIFGVGFDVYDPAGQPAYYQSKHTFTTVKGAKNAIRQLIKKNGDKYLGTTINGVPNGYGYRIKPTGEAFMGSFKGGKANGLGKLFDKQGKISHEGLWENGLPIN